MAKRGKKYNNASQLVDLREYELNEAVALIKKIAFAKFDETLEVSMRLGVNPKYADQMVRGTVVLPHGLGKSKKVAVITSAEKFKEAQDAGADEVGAEDLVDKISKGYLDFDAVVATPDMMKFVGRLGKVLGPRGLMPNPKTGTVTNDIASAVSEVKKGKIAFRVDKFGIVHASIGRVSFSPDQLSENAHELIATLVRMKPSSAKGVYMKSISVASTMSPGIAVDPKSIKV